VARDPRTGLVAFSRALALFRADAVKDALKWLQIAADAGVAPAATLLGQLLYGFAPELSTRYLKAAEAADPRATYLLGLICLRGDSGAAPDPARARELLVRAAERGQPDAMFEYSLLLLWGRGGPEDEAGARLWERRAAEAGHARACLNLGAHAARARDADPSEVALWYQRAAEAGSAEAAARLSRMYAAGDRVPVNDEQSKFWFAYAKALGYEWLGN
jgi:TPR repeat protein